jgi:hypothetical protein
MTVRTHTPDRITVDADGRTTTTIKVQRACNGCSQMLGDITEQEMNAAIAGLPQGDVRTECEHCKPLVELEAQGCKTWQLTPRNITQIDDAVDCDGHYAKGYFEWDRTGGKTVCVGLRIGVGESRIVARYGDHLIRRPDGTWTVHPAPTSGDRSADSSHPQPATEGVQQ